MHVAYYGENPEPDPAAAIFANKVLVKEHASPEQEQAPLSETEDKPISVSEEILFCV